MIVVKVGSFEWYTNITQTFTPDSISQNAYNRLSGKTSHEYIFCRAKTKVPVSTPK